jgi:hypothetical protein
LNYRDIGLRLAASHLSRSWGRSLAIESSSTVADALAARLMTSNRNDRIHDVAVLVRQAPARALLAREPARRSLRPRSPQEFS